MLFTADDLRKFSKGRTSFEYSLMTAIEDMNSTMKEQALLGKNEATIVLYVDFEHWDTARSMLQKRFTDARLSVSTAVKCPTPTTRGELKLQISW